MDVSVYAKPDFDEDQMTVIAWGLALDLDVSVYAKPVYDDLQMWYIYKGLKDGFLVDIYSNPEFTAEQMQELYSGIQIGNPEFTLRQIQEIRIGLQYRLDVSVYAKPDILAVQMCEMRKKLYKDKYPSGITYMNLV